CVTAPTFRRARKKHPGPSAARSRPKLGRDSWPILTQADRIVEGRFAGIRSASKSGEVRLIWGGIGGGSPLPWERSICAANRVRGHGRSRALQPLTRIALDDAAHRQAQSDLSPLGRGEPNSQQAD